MAKIVLGEVSKFWEETRAVDCVSFTAERGRLLVLLGPSGCGKSTTLRLIAGLDEPTGGRIEIDGRDVTHAPPSSRRVSMVFQNYALFPHLNVTENIVFGLKVRKVDAAERARRLARAAELLQLSDLLGRKPAQLSGGQRQRVALGRAIVAENEICLMDEPLSNLDAQLRHEMRLEIRALQRRLGMTMVYVTHDQVEAMSMADRVILMRDGRIEQNGTPEDLYGRPASAFAARFIGTPPMNLIHLDDGPEGAVVEGAGDTPVVRGRGAGLLLGVRPEHVVIGDAGVAAVAGESEYLGADTIVTCRVGGQTMDCRCPGRRDLAPGTAVRLAWRPEHVHIFDATSGGRLGDVTPLAMAA